ncbi:MAG: sigma-54 dependent transcriptional regulator [Candidatus Latescibacterota bacterium]
MTSLRPAAMPNPVKILIVDDEPFNVDVLEQQLEEQGYATCAAQDGQEALKLLARERPDLVLLDWMMPGMDGIEVLRRLRAEPQWRALPVIMLTARTATEDKVRGLDAGADDYVTKPIDEAELWARIRAMLRIARLESENLSLRAQVEERFRFRQIVGRSRPLEQVCALAAKVLDSDATVLLTGETGTGKEVLARCIHGEGTRSQGAFVPVNCGAMAEQLLESELFGHRKGAFTGALCDRPGLFEAAHGGTVFLDEVGEMSAALQVRLLRVLQEGEVRRVGEERLRRVDVRVIAATHRDLQADAASGRFRQDLYYRLNVFPIHLPSLRERPEDVPDLVHHFLQQRRPGGPRTVTARAMDALCRHDWPGNVRELQNEVERACLLAAGEERIDVVHLSERVAGTAGGTARRPDGLPVGRGGSLREVLGQVEREMIEQALARCEGNRTHAARALGVSRWGLVQKIREYGLGAE